LTAEFARNSIYEFWIDRKGAVVTGKNVTVLILTTNQPTKQPNYQPTNSPTN